VTAKRDKGRGVSGACLVTTVRECPVEDRRLVARLLAAGARDADDLRELLDAAGLTAADGKRGDR
jgi:hypothetical protein